jgi:hypothetical protein|tara:strand:+ start:10144 stop:10596 length:453 start_codon:yes stop_codon:yes gene_type:complete
MGKQNQYIAQLEKLLTHLKNAKLSYLKAADNANTSEEKRYFNQEALLRNRFFQEVLSEIQSLGMSYDDLVLGGFNFNQLLISSVNILKASALEKCIHSDEILLEIYLKVTGFEIDTSKFDRHIQGIEKTLDENKYFASTSLTKNQVNRLY